MSLLSFLWKDLLRKRGEFFLTLLGIIFAVCGSFILFSLKLGLSETLYGAVERKNPLSQITVYGSSSGFLKILGGSGSGKTLTPSLLETFKKIPEVRAVAPHTVYQNLASAEMEIFGQKLQTDTLIFGITQETVEEDVKNAAWNESSPEIPVLISRKLIDFYNLSLASGTGLPKLSEETFKGKNIHILPGYSSFFANKGEPTEILAGRIVGFSDRVDLVGISIPFETVQKLNREAGITEEKYNKVFLTLDSPRSVPKVSEELKKEGFHVTSLQTEFQEVGKSLGLIEIILFIVTGIIITTSLLLVALSFWSHLLRRTAELGILRAIGATKQKLVMLFLGEALVIGLVGGILGVLLGEAATQLLKGGVLTRFSLISVSMENLFMMDPALLLVILVGAPLFSGAAALFPILKTLQKPPRELFIK